MNLADAISWARERRTAVLITLRSDGRAQSSDVVYALDGDTFLVSVTDDRAKTRNMRRDPRVVLHVTEPSSWSYVSLDGTAELSPVTTRPDDATSDALCAHYEAVAGGPHPDWDEYRAAMIDERRLLVRITPTSAVGQVH
ncbi:MAG: PPOX class F420-dependent oxidoreductase [Acidimicrobiia bacterium]|nr:PPOX class F420-dependent oxidoreductase [Acidimicrobiia bacterium]